MAIASAITVAALCFVTMAVAEVMLFVTWWNIKRDTVRAPRLRLAELVSMPICRRCAGFPE